MSTSNYSFYAIPAMWVVSIVPHIWAVQSYDANRAPGTPKWDNADPVASRANMKAGKLSPKMHGRIARAEAAQNNSFMNLPWFSAAVVAGSLAGVPASTMNLLAGSYLASRVAFNLAYIFISDSTTSLARTVAYLTGVGINCTLFVKAGNALQRRTLL